MTAKQEARSKGQVAGGTVRRPATAEVTPSRLRPWPVLIWTAVILILAVLGWGLLNSTATRPGAGSPAPAISMQFFDGYEWQERPVASLEELRGQVVVLNFWASWCVECYEEAELLEQTWRAYRDQDVVFLGVAYVDVESKSLAYLEQFDITYPNAPDLRTEISREFEITGVPETFVIDQNGNIAAVKIGPYSGDELAATIDRLLEAGG